ncbi:MAG: DUF1559 domain-containing protein, partial [Phycisphaerae bacterium]|nr:DUF1559 domain-containing protein [Phycisphaerae bacterium]
AKAIDNLIANMMATLHKEPPIKAVFPKLQDLIDAFPINVKNSRLSLHFNNEQTISLFNDIIAKAFQSAQKNAHRAMAMNNLKQIAIAFNMYAEDNKSELPDNINQLLPYLKDKKILTNPRQPNRDIGFIYVKPAVSIKDIKYPSRCIIAYEYHETWPDNGLCAAFADGHAETIANEAHFKELRE